MNIRSLLILILVIFNIGLDQISKGIVRETVIPGSRTELLGKQLQLMNVENSGAFLSMGSDSNPTVKLIFLLILPVIVLGVILYYVLTNTTLDRLSIVGFSSIAGGGIANLYDRFLYGSVTDFLFMDFGGVFRTGIFNVADLSVTTGMILLLISSFLNRPKKTVEP
ncbi:MAG: signal peptidase II [Flavobacteriaceae bacterium]|jgi:signal peptidase II|nr:signal peptidase II [Flavobacteriaceae bacterium]MDG1042495.1 signal peptidase II [Flavobacteriaceae bacterium]MDG1794184.1 signal peptidase II [Flavobacteriaceae bacterium]